MSEATLRQLADELVQLRRAGGYKFRDQERILRQFADHCEREGYPDGAIVKEAVCGFVYGRHLGEWTVQRCESTLRQLAEHAKTRGWAAYAPQAKTRPRADRQPPYVLTDGEIRRLFAAIDNQRLSFQTNKALVDPVLFRVLYGTGLRVSEALNLTLVDFDADKATLRVCDAKNGEARTIPVTGRMAAALGGYIRAAHPRPDPADHLFYSVDLREPISHTTVYLRFRAYLEDAGIPHFPGGPHPHSLRHGFAVQNLRRWAAEGADLAAVLPYLSCYMGHVDARGTQYYLRLTADAYPGVIAKAQIRFGYVIPDPPQDQP
jgi:integrase